MSANDNGEYEYISVFSIPKTYRLLDRMDPRISAIPRSNETTYPADEVLQGRLRIVETLLLIVEDYRGNHIRNHASDVVAAIKEARKQVQRHDPRQATAVEAPPA